jgi:hypothetical protein
MPGGHSTLNTVVLGEGVSKSKYTPYFAHHSSAAAAARAARRGRGIERTAPSATESSVTQALQGGLRTTKRRPPDNETLPRRR